MYVSCICDISLLVMHLVKTGSARTLYLDEGLWQHIQRLVKMGYARNASQLVNQILAEALGKLEGSNVPQDVAYETLRKKHLALLQEIKKLEKEMKDYGSEFQALMGLVENYGLDFQQLSNLEAIISKLLKEWNGSRGALHLFITLLEKAKEKKQIENQLERLRLELAEKEKLETNPEDK